VPNYRARAAGWLLLAALFVALGLISLAQRVSWAALAWLAIAGFYVLVAAFSLRKAMMQPPPPAPESAGRPASEQQPPADAAETESAER
jgi:hypothetical protein